MTPAPEEPTRWAGPESRQSIDHYAGLQARAVEAANPRHDEPCPCPADACVLRRAEGL